MTKNYLYLAMSLDGFIAKLDGSVEWLQRDPSITSYAEFIKTIDTVLMGRTTYDQVIGFELPWPYADQMSYVFTHSKNYKETENIKFTDEDIKEFIKQLKPKKNVWIMGGADLMHQFLEADLIDEIIINIQPIILGEGIPMFLKGKEHKLKLIDSTSYKQGSVDLHYSLLK